MCTFIKYVENTASASDDRLTIKAVESFTQSMRCDNSETLSHESLCTWIVDMSIQRLKISSRKKYFGRIHRLYREWMHTTYNDPFEAAHDAINYDAQCGDSISDSNLEAIRLIIKNANGATFGETINLFLYLLYNPIATIEDVIGLRFDSRHFDCPQIDDIIDAQHTESKRSKYVFGLNQNKKRTPQIHREIFQSLRTDLALAGLDMNPTFSRDSITAMWITAAIKAGIPISKIKSIVPSVPPEYAILGLAPTRHISDYEKVSTIKHVADFINNNVSQWFVMRLRNGQTFDNVQKRIADIDSGYGPNGNKIQLYYPTHNIIKKNTTGGRNIREKVPYLPGIVFFKIQRDKIRNLFNKIGDVAWCYKYTNATDSPYCAIPHTEMAKFQKHIGQLTPDIQLKLSVRDTPFEKGEEVIISGGGVLEGHIGIIESTRNADGSRTYTLTLSEKEYATWTVQDIDETFIDPIS